MISSARTIRSSHVVISRTDNIGDLILTLPMAARLKQLQPGVKISLLCRGYAAQVARYCDDIDDVVELESVQNDLYGWLKASDIDTVILAQPFRELAIASFKAGIKHRIGNARQKLYQLIYCNRRVRFSKGTLDLHESQINFKFLAPYGDTAIPAREEIQDYYHFSIPEDADIAALLRPHAFNLILHTKSNGHGREWPAQHYLTLAQSLARQDGLRIWLTGSAEEGKWMAQHCPQLLEQPNVESLFGKLSLSQLLRLLNQADGMIASGTGPLHVSAAIGQRTLGLFPPTRPMHPGRWAALGRRSQNLCVDQQTCPHCHKNPAPDCPCMWAITPQQVEAVVLSWQDQKNQ